MAYTAPTTRITGELITASIWNTDITDNLDALKDPPSDNYEADEGSDYTTSSTSFTDVDGAGTELTLTITTTGGDVLIGFTGVCRIAGAPCTGYFDVYHVEDAANIGGDDGLIGFNSTAANTEIPVAFVHLLTGVSAGSHTFRLVWKRATNNITLFAGAGTGTADWHPQFWVREAS